MSERDFDVRFDDAIAELLQRTNSRNEQNPLPVQTLEQLRNVISTPLDSDVRVVLDSLSKDTTSPNKFAFGWGVLPQSVIASKPKMEIQGGGNELNTVTIYGNVRSLEDPLVKILGVVNPETRKSTIEFKKYKRPKTECKISLLAKLQSALNYLRQESSVIIIKHKDESGDKRILYASNLRSLPNYGKQSSINTTGYITETYSFRENPKMWLMFNMYDFMKVMNS